VGDPPTEPLYRPLPKLISFMYVASKAQKESTRTTSNDQLTAACEER
jgi:hypothetical protein